VRLTIIKMAMLVVDDKTGGLAVQVRWFGLRVGGRLELLYIHQMNPVNSRNDLVVMMTLL